MSVGILASRRVRGRVPSRFNTEYLIERYVHTYYSKRERERETDTLALREKTTVGYIG